jgi:hypothetical protein
MCKYADPQMKSARLQTKKSGCAHSSSAHPHICISAHQLQSAYRNTY